MLPDSFLLHALDHRTLHQSDVAVNIEHFFLFLRIYDCPPRRVRRPYRAHLLALLPNL